jgi:hypothetical protein
MSKMIALSLPLGGPQLMLDKLLEDLRRWYSMVGLCRDE